jgi:hypothetical protein
LIPKVQQNHYKFHEKVLDHELCSRRFAFEELLKQESRKYIFCFLAFLLHNLYKDYVVAIRTSFGIKPAPAPQLDRRRRKKNVCTSYEEKYKMIAFELLWIDWVGIYYYVIILDQGCCIMFCK